MGVRGFLDSTMRLVHVTTKPTREEVWVLIKISLLGLLVIGGVGYMIRVLFWFIGLT